MTKAEHKQRLDALCNTKVVVVLVHIPPFNTTHYIGMLIHAPRNLRTVQPDVRYYVVEEHKPSNEPKPSIYLQDVVEGFIRSLNRKPQML